MGLVDDANVSSFYSYHILSHSDIEELISQNICCLWPYPDPLFLCVLALYAMEPTGGPNMSRRL